MTALLVAPTIAGQVCATEGPPAAAALNAVAAPAHCEVSPVKLNVLVPELL